MLLPIHAYHLTPPSVQANHTNFTVNNVLACLICTDILQLIGLRSFRAAVVMLLGLLVYDVFWVFGSPAVCLGSGCRSTYQPHTLYCRCLMTTSCSVWRRRM